MIDAIRNGAPHFAFNVWQITAPSNIKSSWAAYHIQADVSTLVKNDKSTGTVALNDKNRLESDPMKSKSPGLEQYHITVYALSAELDLQPDKKTATNISAERK